MPKNIVQMNNKYIKDESQRKRFLEEERKNAIVFWVSF